MFDARKAGEIGMIMIMFDIDMPDNCDECRFNTEYGFCKAMPDNFCGNTDDRKRPEWCPLKEQEAVKPFHKCIGNEFSLIASELIEDAHYDYCPYCGKPITWAKQEGR